MTFLRIFLILFFLPNLCLAGSTLESLPKAKTTWGDVLNPDSVIPEKGFTAFYINTNYPKKVIARENVENVSINYVRKDFHNINSEDFGGYWVGKLFVPKDGVYQINVDKSHAKTRVMLNKHIVLDKNKKQEKVHLETGEYLLEIEHISNYFSTTLQFNIRPAVKIVNTNMLREKIDAMNLPKDTVVYTVSSYESGNKDNGIFIKLKSEIHPYILMLSSSRAAFWDVSKNAPKLVIYNNSDRGSDVDVAEGTPVIAWDGRLNYYRTEGTLDGCECDAIGHFHCSQGTDLKKLSDEIKQWTGFPLAGVSGAYHVKVMQVPEVEINETIMSKNLKYIKKYEKARSSCKKATTQTIEGLMSE